MSVSNKNNGLSFSLIKVHEPNRMQIPKLLKSESKHLDPKIDHSSQFHHHFNHMASSNLNFRISYFLSLSLSLRRRTPLSFLLFLFFFFFFFFFSHQNTCTVCFLFILQPIQSPHKRDHPTARTSLVELMRWLIVQQNSHYICQLSNSGRQIFLLAFSHVYLLSKVLFNQ